MVVRIEERLSRRSRQASLYWTSRRLGHRSPLISFFSQSAPTGSSHVRRFDHWRRTRWTARNLHASYTRIFILLLFWMQVRFFRESRILLLTEISHQRRPSEALATGSRYSVIQSQSVFKSHKTRESVVHICPPMVIILPRQLHWQPPPSQS